METTSPLFVLTLLTTTFSNSTIDFYENNTTENYDYFQDVKMLVSVCKEDDLKRLNLFPYKDDSKFVYLENVEEGWNEKFLSCPKVMLIPEEFCAINNSTVYISAYSVIYNATDYFSDGHYLHVCAPPEMHEEMNEVSNGTDVDDGSRELGILTVVGISISNICLGLHIITFIFIPEIRNLPGKNLVSLTIAVFFSFMFFGISSYFIEFKGTCTAIAILTYYFLISSFLWMNIIGFEIWRSLKLVRDEMGFYAKSKEIQRYLKYSLFGWATPILLVIIIIIVDYSPGVKESYRPGFGEYNCWFKNMNALIIFFFTPLVMVMVSNLLFFIWSSYIICRHTDKLSKDKGYKVLIKRFASYLRLFIVTGLTWIFGILHFAVKSKETAYLFLISTAFYGVFIFISFTLTNKVLRKFRNICPLVGKWVHSTSSETRESKT